MSPKTPPSAALSGAARVIELPNEQSLLGVPCGPSSRGRNTTTHFQILELPPDEVDFTDNDGMQADDCADDGQKKGDPGLHANYAEYALEDVEYASEDEAYDGVPGACDVVPGRSSLFLGKRMSRRGEQGQAHQPGHDPDKDLTNELPEEEDFLDMLMGLKNLDIEASEQADDIDFVVVAPSPVQSQTSFPE